MIFVNSSVKGKDKMGIKPKVVILIILIPYAILLLIGCRPPLDLQSTDLLHEIDRVGKVVCCRWRTDSSNIHCLPLSDTAYEITADPSPALSD